MVFSSKWYLRAASLNLATIVLFVIGSFSWDLWFQSTNVYKLNIELTAPIKGLITYIVYNFVFYWWHRAKHSNSALWLIFHQLHHSIQRIEVLSANNLHPLDKISSLLIGSFLFCLIAFWVLILKPLLGLAFI